MLRLCGARADRGAGGAVSRIPTTTSTIRSGSPRSWPRASRTARFWANQWDNLANRDGHIQTTGPEIWEQTDGKVDGFICAVGTGGTLAGDRHASRSATRTSRSASPTRWARRCTTTSSTASSRPRALDHRGHRPGAHHRQRRRRAGRHRRSRSPTRRRCPSSSTCWKRRGCARRLERGSTSPARSGWRKEMGPGHTIVDRALRLGTRYQSKLFNPAFLRENAGRLARPDIPDVRPSEAILAAPDALVSTEWLAEHLDAPDVQVVDATWYLPAMSGTPGPNIAEAHIPGAVFFDIDDIADTDNPAAPHAAEPGQVLRAGAQARPGRRHAHRRLRQQRLFSAPRAHGGCSAMFGHEDVAVLDGGLRQMAGRGAAGRDRAAGAARGATSPRGSEQPAGARSGPDARHLGGRREQMLDARARRPLRRRPIPSPGRACAPATSRAACATPFQNLIDPETAR